MKLEYSNILFQIIFPIFTLKSPLTYRTIPIPRCNTCRPNHINLFDIDDVLFLRSHSYCPLAFGQDS